MSLFRRKVVAARKKKNKQYCLVRKKRLKLRGKEKIINLYC